MGSVICSPTLPLMNSPRDFRWMSYFSNGCRFHSGSHISVVSSIISCLTLMSDPLYFLEEWQCVLMVSRLQWLAVTY